jgi:hypothetical protein
MQGKPREGHKAKPGRIAPRPALIGSAHETEQIEQNDDRDRNAHHPEQNAFHNASDKILIDLTYVRLCEEKHPSRQPVPGKTMEQIGRLRVVLTSQTNCKA